MFSRRRKINRGAAIAEFWQWWSQARGRVAAALEDGNAESLSRDISHRVHAIDGELQWELTVGGSARHALVVTSAGAATLRATVARWLAGAPPADEIFEYQGSRQPDDEVFTSLMQLGPWELDLSLLRYVFSAHKDAHELDVAVFHPMFRELPEPARVQVAFLALDWALGEEQVELWVGRIEAQPQPGTELRSVTELRVAVAELAARHSEPIFVMLGGQTESGQPVLAMVQAPLRPARWPRFDTHVAVELRFHARDTGLPTDEALTQLRTVEDQIEAAVGTDGTVVAHETVAGRRTLHVYVDGATGAVDSTRRAALRDNPLKTRVKVSHDPGLDQVAHLRPR